MVSYSMEYPIGHFESAVLAVFPPNLLPTPSLLLEGGVWEKEETPILCKHCSTMVFYQHC